MQHKDASSHRKASFIGSICSQRYEAKTKVKKFMKMIAETTASKEVSYNFHYHCHEIYQRVESQLLSDNPNTNDR